MSGWIRRIALLLIAVTLGFFIYTLVTTGRPLNLVMDEAAKALKQKDVKSAFTLAEEALAEEPNLIPALMIAAESKARMGEFEEALTYYDRLPDDLTFPPIFNGRLAKADVLRHLGRMTESVAVFRDLSVAEPLNAKVNRRLSQMFNMTGHRFEAEPYMYGLLQVGQMGMAELMYLGKSAPVIAPQAELDEMLGKSSKEPMPLVAMAEVSKIKEEFDAAEDFLQQAIDSDPTWFPATLRLANRQIDRDDKTKFLATWSRLVDGGEAVPAHPTYWSVCGKWEAIHNRPKTAIRSFIECLKRDPNDAAACHQLGQLLSAEGDLKSGERFTVRAEKLRVLEKLFVEVREMKSDTPEETQEAVRTVEKVVNACLDLNRKPEAWAWAKIAIRFEEGCEWATPIVQGLSQRDLTRMPRTDTSFIYAPSLKITDYPLPGPIETSGSGKESSSGQPASKNGGEKTAGEETKQSEVRFEDVTSETGLDFTYFNSADPQTEGARMFEFTGGGIGVLDFDLDSWPDVVFTQGKPWESGKSQFDQVFRNQRGRFQNVTSVSGVAEDGFSQGIAIGDIDSDGFPDIYIANFGSANRLFHNLGDGTFAEADLPNADSTIWTTSCVIADINADGHPDIFDANYVAADDVASRICDFDGHKAVCGPNGFDPAPDTLLLNSGDGQFANVSQSSGISDTNGRNMGVVAVDLTGQQKISLLVANDEGANLVYTNIARPGDKPRFEETGIISGLAYDAAGKSQGGMGIIADDVNADGLPDIFVTNYYAESNTLYQQLESGLFADSTRGTGLRDPSVNVVGFGTQFIDANLDGRPDLLVANGHLDDYGFRNMPYRMKSQFFQNKGDGTFFETAGSQVGDYFDRELLARPLAKLDYNKDGLTDFAVTHLETPAAILKNNTKEHGNFVAIQLVGTSSNRDAIGTHVSVSGPLSRYRQLTAGDGYQSSNEKVLLFGLGFAEAEPNATVTWPNGDQTLLKGLPQNGHIICIQGRDGFLRSEL